MTGFIMLQRRRAGCQGVGFSVGNVGVSAGLPAVRVLADAGPDRLSEVVDGLVGGLVDEKAGGSVDGAVCEVVGLVDCVPGGPEDRSVGVLDSGPPPLIV
jgi:hypothetical protein